MRLLRPKQSFTLVAVTAILLLTSTCLNAMKLEASSLKRPTHKTLNLNMRPRMPIPMPPSISINAKSWVLLDYQTGQILAEKNPHLRLPAASLNKLMTSYVASQAIAQNIAHLNDNIIISKKAATTPGSKMFIKTGSKISLENLMKGMIVQSGNDASVAIAEHIAGSEEAFAHLMNQTAKNIGLNDTQFKNPTGLPAKDQYSSAFDLAHLARALIAHFPEEYQWYQLKSFTWSNIIQKNRNKLLWQDSDVDGLKTGYTQAARYCFVGSAKKDGMRLIVSVLGAPSIPARMADAKRLLTYGFRFYKTHLLYAKNKPIKSLNIASIKGLKVGSSQDVYVTVPRGHYSRLSVHATVNPSLAMPIKKGQRVGELTVSLKNKTLETLPLVALKDIEKRNLFARLLHWFKAKS